MCPTSKGGPWKKGELGRLWLLCTCRQCRYEGTDKVVYVQAVPLSTGKVVYVQAVPLSTDKSCVRAGSPVINGQSCVRAGSPVINGQSCVRRAASSVINGQKPCTCRQSRYQRTKVVYVQAVPLSTDKVVCVQAFPLSMDKDVYAVQPVPLSMHWQSCVRGASPCSESRYQRTKAVYSSQSRYQRTKVVYVQPVPLSMHWQSCVRVACPVINEQSCVRVANLLNNGQSCVRAGSAVINGQSCVRAASPVINGLTKLRTCRQCRYQRTNLCTCSQSRYEWTKFRNWAEKLKECFETKSPWFSMTGVFVLIFYLCWMKLVLRVLVPLMQRHCISQPVSQSTLYCFQWSSGYISN